MVAIIFPKIPVRTVKKPKYRQWACYKELKLFKYTEAQRVKDKKEEEKAERLEEIDKLMGIHVVINFYS